MPWTERQQALLAAMGLKLWAPPALPSPSAQTWAHTLPATEAMPTTALADVQTVLPPATAAIATPDAPADAFSDAPSDARAAEPPAGPSDAPPAARPTPTRPRQQTQQPSPRDGVTIAPLARTERQALIATLDWTTLRDTVAGCQACSLHQSRTQTVFGVGHRQAHWMVVGEAPGEQEDLAGEPFVGPSGQLLDRMLAALRLTRADEDGADVPAAQRVYIANTLKCRPPRNRNPAPQEMAECEPYLQRQIALVQPRIILAMGGFAIKMLLRTDQPVGKLRGQVHRYLGVPLVVTYHPAYLLRSLQEKAKAWDDLCLAASVVEGGAHGSGDHGIDQRQG